MSHFYVATKYLPHQALYAALMTALPVRDLQTVVQSPQRHRTLVALALFLIWSIYDLFKKDGRWSKELSEPGPDQPALTEPGVAQEVQS